MTIQIRTKSPHDYERSLTSTRLLAARFYIWCLEEAISAKKFPRDESLFKIEMEFRPMRPFGNTGYIRAPLAERLGRIYRRIALGRKSKIEDQAARVAVEEKWMTLPEIKILLAEKALVGDV
jgi:hypothetical protein